MNEKSVRSAVIISPPEKFWSQIQEIRKNHDKAYVRWLPHINMLYPFVPEAVGGFSHEADVIRDALLSGKVEPFPVIFSKESFGYFKHGRRCTIWLKPLQLKRVGSPQSKRDSTQVQMVDYNKPKTPNPSEPRQLSPEPIEVCQVEQTGPSRQEEVGLGNLKDATWDDKDLKGLRETPAEVPVGLDCLRYAEWTPGETSQKNRVNAETQQKPAARAASPIRSKTQHTDYSRVQKQPRHTEVEPRTDEYECLNDSPHPEVIRIQKCLFEAFPHCNDLSTRSPDGFQPHLTLGQCAAQNVDSFMDSLKKQWKDVCFIVDNVHIISRKDDDPFVIKENVKLGLGAI